jgi:lysophospholipase L1-like esterase
MARQSRELQQALRTGEERAERVFRLRSRALRKREAAIAGVASPPALPTVPPQLVKAAGSRGKAGLLIAEGDSWFALPWADDILSLLEEEHGYEVRDVARAGDTIEEMAYGDRQLINFSRKIERAIRAGESPAGVLLSGGGNDVAGPELAMLLNHASSPKPGLNKDAVDSVINRRLFNAYATIIKSVTGLCVRKLGRPLPIIIHGYDWAVPDGRGFRGGKPFPGPWLRPSLEAKGYSDDKSRRALVTELIDEFNKMMKRLPQVEGFQHVHFVDLRSELPNHPEVYKKWWDDELHPSPAGFSKIAKRFAQAIGPRIAARRSRGGRR